MSGHSADTPAPTLNAYGPLKPVEHTFEKYNTT
jgi:hypothetical protein